MYAHERNVSMSADLSSVYADTQPVRLAQFRTFAAEILQLDVLEL